MQDEKGSSLRPGDKIAVVGSGAWGLALAIMLCKMGYSICVWSSSEERAEELSKTRAHSQLKGVSIPEGIVFTHDHKSCLVGAGIVIVAVSSRYVRQTSKDMAPYLKAGQTVVCVSKGIEDKSYLNMAQVIEDVLSREGEDFKGKVVALLGPTHAEEVALDMPSTIVAACPDEDAAAFVQRSVSNPVLRVYTSTDREGAELCGATKNIIAIASGALEGLGYGDNTTAALITRGMAEITRLGVAMGADPQTFFGLAGIGDLIVTATSRHSRNFQAGCLLGQGASLDEAVAKVDGVVEGLNALPAILALAERYGVEMPITQAISEIVYGKASVKDAIKLLMDRDLRPE